MGFSACAHNYPYLLFPCRKQLNLMKNKPLLCSTFAAYGLGCEITCKRPFLGKSWTSMMLSSWKGHLASNQTCSYSIIYWTFWGNMSSYYILDFLGKYVQHYPPTKPVKHPTFRLAGASRRTLGFCDWMRTTPVTHASSGLAGANHEISNEHVTQKVMFKMWLVS